MQVIIDESIEKNTLKGLIWKFVYSFQRNALLFLYFLNITGIKCKVMKLLNSLSNSTAINLISEGVVFGQGFFAFPNIRISFPLFWVWVEVMLGIGVFSYWLFLIFIFLKSLAKSSIFKRSSLDWFHEVSKISL